MAIRILLADDHDIVLEGIRTLVSRSGRPWEICGEARNGEEAVEMIQRLKPDVAVLDITMPKLSGLEAARKITRAGTDTRILMFTMHESGRLETEARESGAQGYVLKAQAARDLIRAIEFLLNGHTFFGAPPVTESSGSERKPGIFLRQAFAFSY
jgi:DNA-binding NarL/FixJ family response regulator